MEENDTSDVAQMDLGGEKMKKQIRQGVFETNSSSMHSLVVMKNSEIYSPEEILNEYYLLNDYKTGEKECVWTIYDNELEFGRSPFQALGTFQNKWLYACASLVSDYNDEVYRQLESLALKYVPGLKRIELPMVTYSFADKDDESNSESSFAKEYGKTEDELAEYLMQKEKDWGIELTYWKSGVYWCFERPFTGYVDENILTGFLQEKNISIEEFLTNKRYVVIQDGDEYGYWQAIKDTGLINMSVIDYEYPERRGI